MNVASQRWSQSLPICGTTNAWIVSRCAGVRKWLGNGRCSVWCKTLKNSPTRATPVNHRRNVARSVVQRAQHGRSSDFVELISQFERLMLNDLCEVLRMGCCVDIVRFQRDGGFHHVQRTERRVISMMTSTDPSFSRMVRTVAWGSFASSCTAMIFSPKRSRTEFAAASLLLPTRMRPTDG